MDKKAQQANALLTQYQKLWKEKYGKTAVVNRYKMKWAMIDIIDSIGYDESKVVLEYYFRTNNTGHPLQWFLYNFESLIPAMEKRKSDDEDRAKKREITKRRVEEWKERNEQLRSQTN